MSVVSRYKLHSPRPGILAPITFQQHGKTKNDHRSSRCHFFKQKATPQLHKNDSLTTLRAIFQCACPLHPQHTHIKQTWRSELVKVKALKYKSSYITGVNLLLSSYTSTNLANLLYTHIRQRQFLTKNVFSITTVCNISITERTSVLHNCIQYFHYRTYFSITQLYTILPLQNILQNYTTVYNTSIT